MKVADVINWIDRKGPGTAKGRIQVTNHMWLKNMLKERFSVGPEGSRTLNGAWLTVYEVEQLFERFLDGTGKAFKSMEKQVRTYYDC